MKFLLWLTGLVRYMWRVSTPQDIAGMLRLSPLGAKLSILNTVVFTLAMLGEMATTTLLLWASASVAVNLYLYRRSMQARTREVKRVSGRARRLIILTSLMSAAPWAALPWMNMDSPERWTHLLVFCVCAGMGAGGVVLLNRVLVAAVCYTSLILGSVIMTTLWHEQPGDWGIAVYCAVYAGFLIVCADYIAGVARDRDGKTGQLGETLAELENAHNRIVRLAFVDEVTGLPNRKAFLIKLDDAIARYRAGEAAPILFFFDLDRFKNVNDSLGHVAGDELLDEIGNRLRRILPRSAISRLGGDEFAVLVAEDDIGGHMDDCAEAVIAALSEPVMLRGREVYPGATLGIARPEDSGTTGGDLLHAADVALRRAKENQRGTFMRYESSMGHEIAEHDRIEHQLRKALRNGDLKMFYQPQICLESGEVTGAEALVRWIDPERGVVSPGVFLPVAEERGLALELSERVFEIVEHDVLRWRRQVTGLGPVAVNIFPVDLQSPEMLLNRLREMRSRGVDGSIMRIEVTENCLVGRGTDEAAMTLDAISDLGFGLSLDDFGTGHASLSHLKRLPVHEIKIDREFVSGLGANRSDQAIVSASIEIARCMGLSCVAEGVETQEQFERLRALGATAGQGYLWSPALSADLFLDFALRHGVSRVEAA